MDKNSLIKSMDLELTITNSADVAVPFFLFSKEHDNNSNVEININSEKPISYNELMNGSLVDKSAVRIYLLNRKKVWCSVFDRLFGRVVLIEDKPFLKVTKEGVDFIIGGRYSLKFQIKAKSKIEFKISYLPKIKIEEVYII